MFKNRIPISKFGLFLFLLPFNLLSAHDYGRPATAEEEKAVKINARKQEEAFNKKDSAAFSKLLKEDATYLIIDDGQVLEGRKEIIEAVDNLFQNHKNPKIIVKVDKVFIPEPGKAIEIGEGFLEDNGVPIVQTIYKTDLVLENGEWIIQSIREINNLTPPTHYEQLKSLAWLVGEWGENDDDVSINTKASFDAYKNFIIQNIKIDVFGVEIMEVEQMIGWDPEKKQIRSWIFDSDGGFGDGTWAQSMKDGKETWTVSSTFILPDGKKGSSTNIYTKIDENSFYWTSTNRKVNGETFPDIKPIKVTRKGKGGKNE